MYEFIILGRLAHMPMHGYLIAKVIGNMLGPFRSVQWGALYPVLSKLEREGLICAEEQAACPDGRARKVYAITDAGRERLHELLMDTDRHLADYSTVFAMKVSLFFLLSQEERIRLCRHYAVHSQQHIDHLERRRRELCAKDHPLPAGQKGGIMDVMNHHIDMWLQERAWAEQLLGEQVMEEAV
jgi:DNA-binding PadR family transcriptional regulator